jgi:V8-like Glu-specific endopeptidase
MSSLRVQHLPPTFTADYNFEGIVALSNCSGSIIRFETSKDSDKAMVLTNGHCYENGMPDPGEVILHRRSSRRFQVLSPTAENLGTINATEVIYSTMTRTDMTLYKLDTTYAQILSDYNVRPFTLTSSHPVIGTPIEVVSGYWERGYTCSVEAFAHELDEGGYAMFDSVRYSRPGCEVIGGTSGSPVIAQGTRNVIAINNTGNEDGERCTMNNPCEIDENGKVTYVQGYSYAQETYLIYSCLTDANELDLNKSGCLLPH